MGQLALTAQQTRALNVTNNQRLSPTLEKCCLRASANVSYENAARDIEIYTGIRVSAKTHQRIVHRYQFPEVTPTEGVEEISLDGGKVRLRTPTLKESCIWKDYKAICVNSETPRAWFGENEELIEWVNQQELASPLTCLGDGHPGIWKIVKQWNCPGERREILDWYHLVENLHKVGGSLHRLQKAEALLWVGKVNAPNHQPWHNLSGNQQRDGCNVQVTINCGITSIYPDIEFNFNAFSQEQAGNSPAALLMTSAICGKNKILPCTPRSP